MFSNKEIKFLSEVIFREDKEYDKAGQFRDPRMVKECFDQASTGETVFKPILLKGELGSKYVEAINMAKTYDVETNEVVVNSTILDDILGSTALALAAAEKAKDDNAGFEVKSTNIIKALPEYQLMLDKYLAMYDSSLKSMKKLETTRPTPDGKNRELVKVELSLEIATPSGFFNLIMPFINGDFFYEYCGSNYVFSALADKDALIKKGELKLLHPYEWLLLEVLKDREGQFIDKAEFLDIIKKYKNKSEGGIIKSFQKKIEDLLSGAEQNAKSSNWDKDSEWTRPIIWISSEASAMSKFMMTRNVYLGLSYNELVGLGHIRGLDLMTGSTSLPAKRVKCASTFDLKKVNGELKLVRIREALSEVEDFICDYKMMFPSSLLTSGKRDNSSTIKDTYNLVKPQSYIRKFRIKTK